MSPATFLETIGSLTVQITLMIGVVAWITCRRQAAAAADWTWTALHAVYSARDGYCCRVSSFAPGDLGRVVCYGRIGGDSECDRLWRRDSVLDLGGRRGRRCCWRLRPGCGGRRRWCAIRVLDAQLTQLLTESTAPKLGLPRLPIEVRVSTV